MAKDIQSSWRSWQCKQIWLGRGSVAMQRMIHPCLRRQSLRKDHVWGSGQAYLCCACVGYFGTFPTFPTPLVKRRVLPFVFSQTTGSCSSTLAAANSVSTRSCWLLLVGRAPRGHLPCCCQNATPAPRGGRPPGGGRELVRSGARKSPAHHPRPTWDRRGLLCSHCCCRVRGCSLEWAVVCWQGLSSEWLYASCASLLGALHV